MRMCKLMLIAALMAALTSPAMARTRVKGLGSAGDPCEVLICMADKLQGKNQPGCVPVNQRFFNIRVYTPWFNPPATARTRQTFLSTCQGSAINRPTLTMIIQRYGYSFRE